MAAMSILRPFGALVAYVFAGEHDASARCNADKKLGGDQLGNLGTKVTARCNVDKQCWDDLTISGSDITDLPQVETSTIMRFGRVMMEQVNTQDTAGHICLRLV